MRIDSQGPHHGRPVLTAGTEPSVARAAIVCIHGRGGSARDMLALAKHLAGGNVALFAPEAEANTWYPYSFLEPVERNEPWLSSALGAVDDVVSKVAAAGVPVERTVLLGFSQGACLMLEYAARNPRAYGALVGFSGGLIGPDGTPRDYEGSLDGTRVFLGCSDVDPHIPVDRVHETATVLDGMGADVTTRIYPRMGHTVNDDEIAHAQTLLRAVAGDGDGG